MSSGTEVLSSARTASDILKWLGWLVILVGAVAAVAAIVAGFSVDEPWSANGYLITDEWVSVGLGILSAAWIAVYTGVIWALIQAVRAVIWYVLRKNPPVVT